MKSAKDWKHEFTYSLDDVDDTIIQQIQRDALLHAAEIAELGSRTMMKGDSPELACKAVELHIKLAAEKI